MLAARTHRWSPFVHYVDDWGALCGARPRHRSWIRSVSLPVTCPHCLLAISRPRFSFCESPVSPSATSRPLHIRKIGMEGMRRSSLHDAKTLCGKTVLSDVGRLEQETLRGSTVCPGCRIEFRNLHRSANVVRLNADDRPAQYQARSGGQQG